MTNNSYKNIFKATMLFAGVQGINILLSLLRTKLVALILGPDGVGLNGIYNETRDLIHETTNVGMDQSGVRTISIEYERGEEKASSTKNPGLRNAIKLTRSLVMVLALLGTVACAMFAYSLSYFTFSDSDHTWAFVALAPTVGMTTIICGELTILKGTRMIKKIATLSTVTIIIGILTHVPLYYLYGIDAVIPAILLFTAVQMVVVMHFSFKAYKPEYCFSKTFLLTGKAMLVLGGAFVLQGFFAHISRLSIQSYINTSGSLSDVGYFNSTTTMITMLIGIFASSLTADFFPRLSGAFSDIVERRLVVHRQTNVLQMFTAPCLVAAILGMHIIVPLLLSDRFLPIIPVLEIALTTCLVRSIATPLQYLPLAAGDSKTYLFVDVVAYSCMVPIYIICYNVWGLIGLGYGICVFNIIDMLWAMLYAKVKYGVMPSLRNILFFTVQTAVIACALLTVRTAEGMAFWFTGILLTVVSIGISATLFLSTKQKG